MKINSMKISRHSVCVWFCFAHISIISFLNFAFPVCILCCSVLICIICFIILILSLVMICVKFVLPGLIYLFVFVIASIFLFSSDDLLLMHYKSFPTPFAVLLNFYTFSFSSFILYVFF